jgi:hypothetical protein
VDDVVAIVWTYPGNYSIVNYLGFLITMWGIQIVLFYKHENLAQVERTKEI